MVAERVGRPVLLQRDPSDPRGGPEAMVRADNRPVSGAGVIDLVEEEEEQVVMHEDSSPVRSSGARNGDEESAPSPTISSASESAPPPTARDLKRVQRKLERATEHLRESLADTKDEIYEVVHDEVQERQQEALTFQKLLDQRVEALSIAFTTALDLSLIHI